MVAGAGVILPFAAGWWIYDLWGKANMEAMFVGAAMTATSVGITAQVLAAKHLLSRTSSQIILAAAVIDDVLALLVLGTVSSVAHGRVNILELALTTIFSITFIAIVMRWGGWTTNALVRTLKGRVRLNEAPFAFTMILLFGLAALSAKAGVAAITGAFLAGTATGGTMSKRVAQQVHGISELFVPFFLAGIGLNLDVRAFAQPSILVLAAVILVAAILSKIIGCGLGAMGYGFDVAKKVGLGMIPRGEFCIVAAQIGLGLKVISPDTFAVVVAMAIATTLLAPVLIEAGFSSEVAAAIPEQTR
jgi:Kef-type K+ transport system membrane component KefB